MFEKIKRGFFAFFGCIWATAMALMMVSSNDTGGAEVNGWIAVLCWVVFIYIIIKRHPVISCVISFATVLTIRLVKFGLGNLSALSEAAAPIIAGAIVLFALYKIIFGSSGKSSHRSSSSRIFADYDCSYGGAEESRKNGRNLVSGSDEYWRYVDAAERIYRDFCAARTTDSRIHHKKRGEMLKDTMIGKYGADDECVRYIIDNYLDLRV